MIIPIMGWTTRVILTYQFHLDKHGDQTVSVKLLFLWCISYFYHMYMVLSVKYVDPSVTMMFPEATDQGTSSSHWGPNDSALLTNICHWCDVLLARVSKHRWHELDDQYADECTSLPSEWRGIMRCMAMVSQEIHDLWASGVEPLVQDLPYSD